MYNSGSPETRRKKRVRLSLAEKMQRAQMLAQVTDRWVVVDLFDDYVLAYHVLDRTSANHKLYQIILSRDPIYAGLYEVNAYDIRYRSDPTRRRMIYLTTRRYDKVAGFAEPHLPNSLPNFDAFCQYLLERGLLSREALEEALRHLPRPQLWQDALRIRMVDS